MNGFVYVATGEGYLREAIASAETLRRAMPGAAIAVMSDVAPSAGHAFDQVIRIDDVRHGPIDKLRAIDAPFDRVVYLDTDTIVGGDLSALFDVLERFDVAALPEIKRGWDYRLPEVPAAFAELNTGVIAFRRTPQVSSLFADWRRLYDELHAGAGLTSDQPAFRLALWRSAVRFAPLPSEYHFLSNAPNYIMWDAKLIHGRGDLAASLRDVNRVLEPRAYVPGIGVVPGFRGRRGWVRETLRVVWRMARVALSRPADPSRLAPKKWWLAEP
jgi:hypothetical protein